MGNVEAGSGTVETGTKSLEGTYTAASRFADGEGTNPEEMLAAAHASCFSMALSLILGPAGHAPESVETDASVYLRRTDDGCEIHKTEPETGGRAAGGRGGARAPPAARARPGWRA
jgi:osmotically inducible protein OsmC